MKQGELPTYRKRRGLRLVWPIRIAVALLLYAGGGIQGVADQ
jgi:hypothetical protein